MINAKLHNEMVNYFFRLTDEPEERATKFLDKYPNVSKVQFKADSEDIQSRLDEEGMATMFKLSSIGRRKRHQNPIL